MYFNMALENVKRSFKEYWIYFITLTIGVCIFYSFNALDVQEAISQIGKNENTIILSFFKAIKMSSFTVALGLGFMMIYINSYIFRSRTKEFATYMTLGMGSVDISKVLLIETSVVAAISLVVGIGVGFLTSQGIGFMVVRGLGIDKFIIAISPKGVVTTIRYFLVLHIFNGLYSLIKLRKMNIAEGVKGKSEGKEIILKGALVYVIELITALLLIGFCYGVMFGRLGGGFNVLALMMNHIRGFYEEPGLILAVLAGITGTMLFFHGLSCLVYIWLNRFSLSGIRLFSLSQISRRVGTNVIGISIVCVMMVIAITALSFGVTYKVAIDKEFNNGFPYDASIELTGYREFANSPEEYINNIGYKFGADEEVLYLSEYSVVNDKFINKEMAIKDVFPASIDHGIIGFIKLSDYNNVREFNGKNQVKIKGNEILVYTRDKGSIENFNMLISANKPLTILGKDFNIKELKNENIGYINDYINGRGSTTIIIDDSNSSMLVEMRGILNVNYSSRNEERAKKLVNYITCNMKIPSSGHCGVGTVVKNEIYKERISIQIDFIYNCVFIGLVFLMGSMTILAMHLIVNTEENISSYRTLKKLGAGNNSIYRGLLLQIGAYFLVPLILAYSHSIVAMEILKVNLFEYNLKIFLSSVPIVFIVVFIIYGLYFIATYIVCKNIVKKNI
ncbi:MAG: ABC transporter permease [Clostridium sp.]